jgi:hypothetical protein
VYNIVELLFYEYVPCILIQGNGFEGYTIFFIMLAPTDVCNLFKFSHIYTQMTHERGTFMLACSICDIM